MIRLFNHNHPSVYLALLALSALSFSTMLLMPVGVEINTTTPFSQLFSQLYIFKGIGFLLSVFLVFLNSVVINSLFIERETSSRSSHLASSLFIIFSAIITKPDFMIQNQVLIVFFLTSIFFLQRLENANSEINDSFFIGFFISLASLFTPFALLLVVIMLPRIVNTRWSTTRVLFLSLLGYVIPIYLIWTGYFLFDKGQMFIDSYLALFNIDFVSLSNETVDIVLLILFVILTLIALFSAFASDAYKNVLPRAWIIFWIIVGLSFFVVGSFFSGQNGALVIASTPLSGFLCFFILGHKKKLLRALVYYSALLALIIDGLFTLNLISHQ